MSQEEKFPEESLTILTNIVLPSETNKFGNMFGGELLSRIDRASSIAASKHSGREVVTISVNRVYFIAPIPLGAIVSIESKVSRVFNTSIEVITDVWIEHIGSNSKEKVNEAIYMFVCLKKEKEESAAFKIPKLIPKSPLEKERFKEALIRKDLSLLWANKLDKSKAYELKKYFLERLS